MQKPKLPKSRLIREGILPERNPITDYRIKKITRVDGDSKFHAQKRVWWGWKTLGIYTYLPWANERILEDYNKSRKVIVEFITPDISQTGTEAP